MALINELVDKLMTDLEKDPMHQQKLNQNIIKAN